MSNSFSILYVHSLVIILMTYVLVCTLQKAVACYILLSKEHFVLIIYMYTLSIEYRILFQNHLMVPHKSGQNNSLLITLNPRNTYKIRE